MGEICWFCSGCGDGPVGIWQSHCAICCHARCAYCMIKDTGSAPDPQPQYIPPSTRLLSPSSVDAALPDEEDQDDNASTSSMSADSMFSTKSVETRATSFINDSGFTQAQVQGARRSLVSILRDDEDLAPLYLSAQDNPQIGAKRLRRKMREIIKTYAGNLNDEASDHLQLSASRLVRAEASRVARCIASEDDKHIPDPVNQPPEDSDEEAQEPPVDQTYYGELNAFCAFLRDGEAFLTLTAQVQAFCSPEMTPSVDKCTTGGAPSTKAANDLMERTWVTWREDAQRIGSSILLGINSELLAKAFLLLLTDAVFLVSDDLLIAMGLLEPPLGVGWTRIRCQCSCGEHYFDDVLEICEDGIQMLIHNIQDLLTDTTIKAVPFNERTPVQQYTGRFSGWISVVYQRLTNALSWRHRRPTGLPHHNARNAAPTTPTATDASSPQQQPQQQAQDTLDLMSCVHGSGEDIVLLQHDLRSIGNDLALFNLLKQQIFLRRNRLILSLSCRSIQGVFFSKFRLLDKERVEVRHHDPCCTSRTQTPIPDSCECLPPKDRIDPAPNAEYSCNLPTPPSTWPPILPKPLAHMIKHPEKINKERRWVIDLIPKHLKGPLVEGTITPNEGWGFYFEEIWDFNTLTTLVFGVFQLGSLVFAICWTVLKGDIQGAFGVSAYIVTACGMFIAFVVRQTGKVG